MIWGPSHKRKKEELRRRFEVEACEPRRLLAGLVATVVPGGSPNPEVSDGGTQVQLGANVIPPDASDPVPTGTMQFFVGTTPISPIETIYPGTKANQATVSFQSSFFPIQDTTVTADYSGDANYAPSSGTYVEEYRSNTFVSLFTSPSSIPVGGSETLTAIVNTEGDGTTPTGTVIFEIWDGVDDNTIRTIDTEPVTPNGQATFVTSSLPAGTDNLIAYYSGDGHYLETIDPSTQGVNTVIVGPSSSTLITLGRSTLPASVVAGSKVHGTVAVDLHNAGAKTEKGTFVISVDLSPDGLLDGSQSVVASGRRAAVIPAGKTIVENIPVQSLPASLNNGTYTLLAQTTDPAGDTSVSPAGGTLSISAAHLAFSEQVLKLSLPPSKVSGAAVHGSILFKVLNSGNIASLGSTAIQVFASSDGTTDDGLFLSVSRHLLLKANGGSTQVALPLTHIPSGLNGDYDVVVQLTDAQQNITSAALLSTINIALPEVVLGSSILSRRFAFTHG
jgi:hypothetical protein